MELVVIAQTEHGAVTLPTLECVEEAREVADTLRAPVRVLLPGHEVEHLADTLAAHGADAVILVEHAALGQFSADGWLAALEPVLREAAPALILAPDTGHMRAWLPRLAVRRQAPLVSGCIQIAPDADGQFELTRATYGGARHEKLVCPGASTVVALLSPGVRGVAAARPGRRAAITRLTPALDPSGFRDRALRTLPADPHTVDLSEAERIVSGGLGIGGPEGVALLQQLADLLGASLGGTRVIADRGWIPTERFIGTTGKIVAPKLYIGFGISGAGQHISGLTESETVIAVNTDRTAPLFSIADLGVVGDLHQIVPELINQLREHVGDGVTG